MDETAFFIDMLFVISFASKTSCFGFGCRILIIFSSYFVDVVVSVVEFVKRISDDHGHIEWWRFRMKKESESDGDEFFLLNNFKVEYDNIV